MTLFPSFLRSYAEIKTFNASYTLRLMLCSSFYNLRNESYPKLMDDYYLALLLSF